MSRETRRRVEAAVAELGYMPNHVAQSLKSRRTRTIGMVISDLTNPFFPEMVRGAEDAALERGYLLSTFNTDDRPEREQQIFSLISSRRFDGLLVVTALRRGSHPHLEDALRSGLSVVCLDRLPRGLAVDSVTVDNVAGVEMAMEHLIAQGFRRIAYIGGGAEMYIAPQRLAGYRKAMKRARLSPIEFVGDFRRESGREIGRQILAQKRRPEAVFTANILMAAGFLEAVSDAGLHVPRDIALATFDRISFLQGFHPQLTCVEQPNYRMGFEGARLLIERLEGARRSNKPVHLVLPCNLVVGESTRRSGRS